MENFVSSSTDAKHLVGSMADDFKEVVVYAGVLVVSGWFSSVLNLFVRSSDGSLCSGSVLEIIDFV